MKSDTQTFETNQHNQYFLTAPLTGFWILPSSRSFYTAAVFLYKPPEDLTAWQECKKYRQNKHPFTDERAQQ